MEAAMNHNFQEFEAELRAQDFDEVVEVNWPPNAVIDTHQHAFAAKALVVRGEMWLTIGSHTQHILPGGTFELTAAQPHAERYGAEGATYWVGRRAGS
jgi:quercetin dioxygenase-like cupin family protein